MEQNDKSSLKDVAIFVGKKPIELIPALLEASRMAGQSGMEDAGHNKAIIAFRLIDTKQTELEVYEKASGDVVVENKIIGKDASGTDIVQRKTIKSRNINHLARNIGRQEVAEIIRLLLVNLNNYFNVKDGLNHYQILEIAEQIIDECGDKLFIDELVYIFKKAKSSTTKDNSVYNHIDGSIIFGWIDKHIEHKFQQREKRSAEHKAESFDLPNLPNGMLKSAAEKINSGYRKNIVNMTDIPKTNKPKKKK